MQILENSIANCSALKRHLLFDGLRFAQLGPQITPVIGEHLSARHLTGCCTFYWPAEMKRNRALSRRPPANVGGVRTNCRAQGAQTATLFIKVSFQVHTFYYSDSLNPSL